MKHAPIIAAGAIDPRSVGITARDLMRKEFPPIRWVIPGYIVEGLTVFAGAPKLGKSWAALDWANAVSTGGKAFGSVQCDEGDVLYLALEDNLRRLQSRLRIMGVEDASERLTFHTEWPTLDGECIPALNRWLDSAADPRLIVIDIFQKVRGNSTSKDTQYELDYKFAGQLQRLAISTGIGMVLVHHTRKQAADDPFDAISGTRGITGAADSALVLTKDADSQQPMLYGRGRDLEEFENALEFQKDCGIWRILGDANLVAKTAERREILQVLSRSATPMTPTEIAETLGKKRPTISKTLGKLWEDGKVEKPATGKYILPQSLRSLRSPNAEESE